MGGVAMNAHLAGEVDDAAPLGKRNRAGPCLGVPLAVRRPNMLDRHATVHAPVENVVGDIAHVAQMNVEESGLSGNHAANADIREQVHDLLLCRETRAMIAKRNLDSDALWDRKEVPAHRPRHS